MPCELRINRKCYAGADGVIVEAVRDLHLLFPAGSTTAIVGPSGCGKTTALNILLGLDRDFEGKVRGRPLRSAAVFQEPRLLPWRTVEDNVRLGWEAAGGAVPVAALFEAFDLADARGRYPGELSLGMARRAALVRALAVSPELLVLDEPLVSLDETTAARLLNLIIHEIIERHITTVLVTHDVEEALKAADRIAILSPRPATLCRLMELPPLKLRDAATLARLREQISGAAMSMPR